MGKIVEIYFPEEEDIPLKKRVLRANKLFCQIGHPIQETIIISIHVNAAGNGKKWHNATGWCCYTYYGIASMTAGRLAQSGEAPDGLVLIAPGSVIKEACQAGTFFNARFDPSDPPEYVRCWGFKKLWREYLLSTQQLDIYGTAASYQGKVLILHGSKDGIVPLWCSERYQETYGDKAELVIVEGENHLINRRRNVVVEKVVAFFRERYF